MVQALFYRCRRADRRHVRRCELYPDGFYCCTVERSTSRISIRRIASPHYSCFSTAFDLPPLRNYGRNHPRVSHVLDATLVSCAQTFFFSFLLYDRRKNIKCKLYGDPRGIDKLDVSRGERNERLHMQTERRCTRERMVCKRLSGIKRTFRCDNSRCHVDERYRRGSRGILKRWFNVRWRNVIHRGPRWYFTRVW